MEKQINPQMFTSTRWESTRGVGSSRYALDSMLVHAARHGGGPFTRSMAAPAVSHSGLNEGGRNGFSSL
jgi:hypothetical protein